MVSASPTERELVAIAAKLRASAVKMVYRAKASHIGSCLSIADIMAALYFDVLKISPQTVAEPDRDRFILSKGHAAAMQYAALAERGFIEHEQLNTYCENDSPMTGHVNYAIEGVEVATGSLGHGLPIGCGMALAADEHKYRVFVLLSDGELDEGSNWEAILFAAHHKLDNLVAIVDYNKIQSFGTVKEVLDLDPLAQKFADFGWAVRSIDGHNMAEVSAALHSIPHEKGKPTAIIANTVKGKGISFMENTLDWHYKSPSPEQLEQALAELESVR
ncbi:MAG TPA: transketolase [Planktothrix sp.]